MAATKSATTKKPSKAQANKDASLKMGAVDKHEITDEQKAADKVADKQVANDAMAQMVAQTLGNGAAANLSTPDEAKAGFEKDLAALKAKYGVNANVKITVPRATKVQMNGVTRPSAETTCGKVWATADAISAATHAVCPIAALKEHPDMAGVNDHTIKTQYAKWRAFNGVSGRLPRIHAVHQTQGEYEGIPPAVPKAE